MAAVWPSSLPTGFLANSDEEVYEDNTLSSPMDVGPAKVRRRSTAAAGELSGTTPPMDAQQRLVFDDFWRRELRSGVLAFWLGTSLMRFKAGSPPRIKTVRTAKGLHYTATITLERLP